MSASTAIGMVGESLITFLEDEMSITPAVNVTLLAPDESGGGNRRVNLFLYKVVENSYLKNSNWQVSRTDPTQVTPPPLSLSLFYLLTAYAQADPQTGNVSAHEILGDAMRVFHQNPFIPDIYLVPGLSDAREQLKISQNQLDLDELSKVWTTFGEPYRLSVAYEVSVVQLDQAQQATRPMANRVTVVGVPNVVAPFAPPAVISLSPISGPAGTVVTFSGSNLRDWQAYVRMFGRRIADALTITGDSFDVTVPVDLPAGFHEMRVDISRLHRSTFFFEVTP